MGEFEYGGRYSRRRFLQAGAGAALLPYGLLDDLGLSDGRPPGFPDSVPLARRRYENWARSIRIPGLWTCRPRSAQEAVDVVNWAHGAGWTVRPRGAMHAWSPLTVTADSNRNTKTVLVDTSLLSRLEMVSSDPAAVRVGAGATMLALLEFLERRGLALTSYPATGEPTIAGALAIGAHGAALPAANEALAPGHTFGSLSNLVTELTAVAWDPDAGRYALRTFAREEADAKALLVHIGRAFLVDVTLRAGPSTAMRCQSHVHIPAAELFAAPGAPGTKFADFIERSGRAEAIWFPFTEKPWLKVWTPSPVRPPSARVVTGPYNYPFSDLIPKPVAGLADRLVRGADFSAPAFGQLQIDVTRTGLAALDAADLWGAPKDVQLYIRASTIRVDELGYGVLTSRSNVQRVVHEFCEAYKGLVAEYRARGMYPMNMPVEIRCSGIDAPGDAGIPGAEAPVLAATAPRADHPEWDTVVWPNTLTLPGTRGSYEFYRDLERWMLATFDGEWATLRPEWSKMWAFTAGAGCADPEILEETIPGLVSAGRGPDSDWDWAHARLSALDPHAVLSNEFLNGFR